MAMSFGATPPPMPAPMVKRKFMAMPMAAAAGGPTAARPGSAAAPPSFAAPAASAVHAAARPGQAVEADSEVSADAVDFTQLPVALDAKLLALDPEQALRPTVITAGSSWSKRFHKSLLSEATTSALSMPEQERARKEAFDLLDALSRSGSLSVDCCELHVVIATTHHFTQSLIDTVVCGNVNPIERVERSMLLLATTIHDQQASELIKPEQRERIARYSATQLFAGEQREDRLMQ